MHATIHDQPGAESRWLAFASGHPFLVGLAGSLLLWLSFPPVGWWPLAWVAPLPWLMFIAVTKFSAKRPFAKFWTATLIYWAATLYFIPIPHWALWFGWVALSLFLTIYPMLFVWSARELVHRWQFPVWIVAPVVYVVVEWLRAHILSGFAFLMLAHSQYQQTALIQISSWFGGYALSFVMVLFSALLLRLLLVKHIRWRIGLGAASAAVVSLVAIYGGLQLDREKRQTETSPVLTAALVQGSIDTVFPDSPAGEAAYFESIVSEYRELHRQALDMLEKEPETSLENSVVIWPESKWPVPVPFPLKDLSELGPKEREEYEGNLALTRNYYATLFGNSGGDESKFHLRPMIVGGHMRDLRSDDRYNSAFLIDGTGTVASRYAKNHLVIFGEYVPLEKWIPALGEISPNGRGLARGSGPVVFRVGDFNLSPSICFESTVPHLIRRHVNELTEQGAAPDILVNVTDDGWFFGTSLLDLHLACNVFRAVENRIPVVVAANTGFSANIDEMGRILDQGPRRSRDVVLARVVKGNARSVYRKVGDTLWIVLGVVSLILIVYKRWFQRDM